MRGTRTAIWEWRMAGCGEGEKSKDGFKANVGGWFCRAPGRWAVGNVGQGRIVVVPGPLGRWG